jgi:hypothetical protein
MTLRPIVQSGFHKTPVALNSPAAAMDNVPTKMLNPVWPKN